MEYKVHSRFDRPQTPFYDCGDGHRPVYEERFDDGVLSLVCKGRQPLNDYVQESLESTLVYNVLKRFNAGDPYALQKNIGVFGDVSGAPRNLAEAQQLLIDVRRDFEKLPVDIRSRYGHNPMAFAEAISRVPNDQLSSFFESLGFPSEVKKNVAKVRDEVAPTDE